MRAPGKSTSASLSIVRAPVLGEPRQTPPARRGSRIGLPAPRSVLDGGRTPRLRLLLRQRGDAQLPAQRHDPRPLGALTRCPGLRLGLRRSLFRFVLLALRAPAQAAGSIQIARGGGGGTHGVSFLRVIAASRPLFFRAASNTRRPRDRCAQGGAGRASGAARRPAGRRESARRSPALASSIRGRPARRSRSRGASPGAAPARSPAARS